MFAAVRNLFLDHCRRQATISFERLANPDVTITVAGEQQRVDDRNDIQTLLSRLTSNEREVLYLSSVEQFTAREIGELTGSPRGTVLSLLSRAKKKLSSQPVAAQEP